jgi:acetyl esterase
MTLAWDPVLESRLHFIAGLPAPSFSQPTPEQLAAQAAWDAAVPGYLLPDVEVEDLSIPGPLGPVDARVYRPRGVEPTHGFVWVHGGGFAMGDLDMPEADVVSRELCARAGLLVISLDYRKARPGQHYPVCQNDVFAAWQWITHESGWLPGAWSLGGASAGANLAAGTVQRLRDDGAAVPQSLLLIYPAAHEVMPAGSAEYQEALAHVPARLTFPAEMMTLINANYVGENAGELTYAWPGQGDLSGFPRTLILNCEYDTLRASGEKLAEDLYAAGCDVMCVMEQGVPHGHLNVPGLPGALHSIETMLDYLNA